MMISGMVKSSLIDYPGLIACVLFMPGCNYDCFYCHNRSIIDGSYKVVMPIQYVKDFLSKRKGLIDAVVITGGEPTLQNDLISIIKYIKELGYKLKLDTNGSSPKVIKTLIDKNLCDYFAVDYKAPASRYKQICGENAEVDDVLETIELLLDNDMDFEVRTTVIPQLSKENIICMAKELPVLPRYVLNRYRKPDHYKTRDKLRIEAKPYTQMQINEIVDMIRLYQPNTIT